MDFQWIYNEITVDFQWYFYGRRDRVSEWVKQVIYDSSYTNGLEDKPPIYRP